MEGEERRGVRCPKAGACIVCLWGIDCQPLYPTTSKLETISIRVAASVLFPANLYPMRQKTVNIL